MAIATEQQTLTYEELITDAYQRVGEFVRAAEPLLASVQTAIALAPEAGARFSLMYANMSATEALIHAQGAYSKLRTEMMQAGIKLDN